MWWNTEVEQWSSVVGTGMVEQCGGKVEQCWWNSGIVMVEECGDRVEQ